MQFFTKWSIVFALCLTACATKPTVPTVSLDEGIQQGAQQIGTALSPKTNAGTQAEAQNAQTVMEDGDPFDFDALRAKAQTQKPIVAVVYVKSNAQEQTHKEKLFDYVIDKMIHDFVQDKKVIVVEREKLDLIKQETDYQLSGEVREDTIRSIGRKLGAEFIISAGFVERKGFYEFMVKAVNVETGDVRVSVSTNVYPDGVLLPPTTVKDAKTVKPPKPTKTTKEEKPEPAKPTPATQSPQNTGGTTAQTPPASGTVPATPPAQSGVTNGLEWVVVDGKSVTITRYTGTASVLNIPASIQGLPVTAIGDRAFYDRGLTSVSIPNSVTTIGNYAFERCFYLTIVSIPSSVTTIGEWAFSGCWRLTSVSIPSSVTAIGNCAFYGCSRLTSVSIPSSVTAIGNYAFLGCNGLTSISVDERNPNYTSNNGVLFDKQMQTLIQYPTGKSGAYTIPSSVTVIGGAAFSKCSGLISVSIPSSVTTIGDFAFSECSGLTSVSIPSSVTTIGKYAFSHCSRLTSISIPSSVTAIRERVFSYCSNLTSVSIPSSVTAIGSNAFNGCSGLTSISIPSSVTTIGDSAFLGCSSLTSVSIPSSVTAIGSNAFNGCSGLTSVSIPSSVTTIWGSAFLGCSGLKEVTLSRKTKWDKNMFPPGAQIRYSD